MTALGGQAPSPYLHQVERWVLAGVHPLGGESGDPAAPLTPGRAEVHPPPGLGGTAPPAPSLAPGAVTTQGTTTQWASLAQIGNLGATLEGIDTVRGV